MANGIFFFTVCQWSCANNVFTRVCLSVCGRGDPMWPLPMMDWILLYRAPCHLDPSLPGHGTSPHCVGIATRLWPLPASDIWCSLQDPPTLIYDDSYWTTFWSLQAGGTHPIGMLSCGAAQCVWTANWISLEPIQKQHRFSVRFRLV